MSKIYNSKHHKEYVISKSEFSDNDKKTLLAKLFDLECTCTSKEKALQKIKQEIKIIEKVLLDFITNFANDYFYNRNFTTNFFNDNCEPKVEDKLILATDECMAIIANYKQKLKFLFNVIDDLEKQTIQEIYNAISIKTSIKQSLSELRQIFNLDN